MRLLQAGWRPGDEGSSMWLPSCWKKSMYNTMLSCCVLRGNRLSWNGRNLYLIHTVSVDLHGVPNSVKSHIKVSLPVLRTAPGTYELLKSVKVMCMAIATLHIFPNYKAGSNVSTARLYVGHHFEHVISIPVPVDTSCLRCASYLYWKVICLKAWWSLFVQWHPPIVLGERPGSLKGAAS